MVWMTSTFAIANLTNSHASTVGKNPADDLSALFPHRDTWRSRLVGIRSCRARHCKFAVVRSLQPCLGDTADTRDRSSRAFAEPARLDQRRSDGRVFSSGWARNQTGIASW